MKSFAEFSNRYTLDRSEDFMMYGYPNSIGTLNQGRFIERMRGTVIQNNTFLSDGTRWIRKWSRRVEKATAASESGASGSAIIHGEGQVVGVAHSSKSITDVRFFPDFVIGVDARTCLDESKGKR
jgi:hypothetical protein